MNKSKYCSPWASGWREAAWRQSRQDWDVIVIGGGITGAGILAVAARTGQRVLLLEKGDFSSGTSSRSSKLVHGGLRYLKRMQIKLTRESVKERQYMLRSVPGLVEPLGFIYPLYEGDSPGPWLMEMGLGIYTHLASDAGKYRRLDTVEIGMMAPGLRMDGLERGYHYGDAQTDDARLVLRVLQDALIASCGRAEALNYARVTGLLREDGKVVGVRVCDEESGKTADVLGAVVINATGAWADELRNEVGGNDRLRPLCGSHIYFNSDRFPVYQAVAFTHPDDGRPVFVYPWEGITLVGTTDIDFSQSLSSEPSISLEEADYLLRAVQVNFPDLELNKGDVLTAQAGVRPVVDTGKKDPSEESRDHVVWLEHGLLTVTGGKLTTFRPIAIDVLQEAHKMNKRIESPSDETQVFEKFETKQPLAGLDASTSRRLCGRYGSAVPQLVAVIPDLLTKIQGTPYLWAELLWAAENEAVQHLDDLLLRRLRLGILLPDGGQSLFPRIKDLAKGSLGWDDARWEAETERYGRIWKVAHGLPSEWYAFTMSEK